MLDGTHRQVFILMRLRRTEQQIAGELGLRPEEVRTVIDEVRHRLGRVGMLYLVEDPEMVSIHGMSADDPDIPLPSYGLGIEDRVVVREFVKHLRKCLEVLPSHQSVLLRLRFRNELTAGKILDFIRRTGIEVIPGKPVAEISEQEIYSAINAAIGKVLKELRKIYTGDLGARVEHLKLILEEFEI